MVLIGDLVRSLIRCGMVSSKVWSLVSDILHVRGKDVQILGVWLSFFTLFRGNDSFLEG